MGLHLSHPLFLPTPDQGDGDLKPTQSTGMLLKWNPRCIIRIPVKEEFGRTSPYSGPPSSILATPLLKQLFLISAVAITLSAIFNLTFKIGLAHSAVIPLYFIINLCNKHIGNHMPFLVQIVWSVCATSLAVHKLWQLLFLK